MKKFIELLNYGHMQLFLRKLMVLIKLLDTIAAKCKKQKVVQSLKIRILFQDHP